MPGESDRSLVGRALRLAILYDRRGQLDDGVDAAVVVTEEVLGGGHGGGQADVETVGLGGGSGGIGIGHGRSPDWEFAENWTFTQAGLASSSSKLEKSSMRLRSAGRLWGLLVEKS